MADAQELSAKAQELVAEIQAAGNKVRELKTAKADITDALATLKAAKAAYKAETGAEYGAKPKKNKGKGSGGGKDDEFEVYDKIIAAMNAVNKLKIEEADTAAAEAELAKLKEQYKAMAGKDFEMSDGKKKKKKKGGGGGGGAQPQGQGKKGKKPKKEKPVWGKPGAKAAKKAAAAAAKAVVKEPFVNKTPKGEKKSLAEFPTEYEPQAVEAAWQDWWEASGFYDCDTAAAAGVPAEEKFVMVIPPPNVTGTLHLGHALMGSIEDCITRWHRMSGRKALWVPGTDHAGIATQSVVEKQLYKETQQTRHDLGREKFLEKVWEWKSTNAGRITKQLRSLGASCAWERECFTMDPKLNVAVKEAFVRMFEKGIIYREERLVNWCCALNTAISNIEVDKLELQEPKEIKVPNHTDQEKYKFGEITEFAYPVEGGGPDDVIIVATTRLETMMGDTAVAVHPDDERFKHLHGKFVIHPFNGRRIPIITDGELVKIGFGTGAVKITPAHDENDYASGKRHGLEFINILNDDGTLNANAAPFEGLMRFDARRVIEEELAKKGLFKGKKANIGKDGGCMVIPRCSRSGDIIEPRLKPQWYVDCTEMAARSVAAVKEGRLKLIPKVHEQTWFHWLEDIRPWCISRQLWWGHRIPAYQVAVDGKPVQAPEAAGLDDRASASYGWVVGRTKAEAMANAVERTGATADRITLSQDEDVLDTWFSSGLWPFSVFGWPEKTPDLDAFYPGSLLETGHDILFFWVARMVMMGLELTDQLPFTDVYLHAMVRDAHGRKMSKSKGNVIDPLEVIYGASLKQLNQKLFNGNLPAAEIAKAQAGQAKDFPTGIPECGTDALRFGLLEANGVGKNVNLNIRIVEVKRQFCNKMWQATRFMMGKLGDGFAVTSDELLGEEQLALLQPRDRWILDRLNTACAACDDGFVNYHYSAATQAAFDFFLKELCDVYIELTKPVFAAATGAAAGSDAAAARDTTQRVLWMCLDRAMRLFHPFMPFVTEELWQRMPGRGTIEGEPPSIMLARYPKAREAWAFPEAAAAMETVLATAAALRSLVQPYNLKYDQGAKVHILSESEAAAAALTAQASDVVALVTGVGSVDVHLNAAENPQGCAACQITADTAGYVELKGLVDPAKELAKKAKKIKQLEGAIKKYENVIARGAGKMSEEVVASKQKQLDEYRKELAGQLEQVETLKAME